MEAWQERFTRLLNRKLSTGETIGILARLCTARFTRLAEQSEPASLVELVERMIGE